MTNRQLRFYLRAMAHCTCRIDPHCLRQLEHLEYALQVSALTRLQVLRQLRGVQRCECYFATHCIETLCTLVDDLSAALRRERAERRQEGGAHATRTARDRS